MEGNNVVIYFDKSKQYKSYVLSLIISYFAW